MANITILVDTEQGHIFSTLSLARKLKARGHGVYYLGVADVEEMIRKQGMEFRPVLQDLMPLGSAAKLRTQFVEKSGPMEIFDEKQFFYFAPLLHGKMLDGIVQEIEPAVMLLTCHRYFEAIAIRYKYNLPVVLLNPIVRDEPRAQACQVVIEQLVNVPGAPDLIDVLLAAGVTIRNFADVANLILSMPELVFLPKAFELPDRIEDRLVFYAGPEIDLDRAEDPFCWDQLRSDRPLIYCSLGSQLDMKGEISRRLIRTVIDAVTQRPDWQLVVSLGSRLEPQEFGPLPPHVHLSRWVPQMQMLARASVMITHAGVGTVKECIISRVPMLAVPLMRDQFSCAERIVHHGLGLRGDIEHIKTEELSSMLAQLIADDSCRKRVEAMSEEFRRVEALNIGVDLIEKVAVGGFPD
jgi:zeaxanthin glucosyltransferase